MKLKNLLTPQLKNVRPLFLLLLLSLTSSSCSLLSPKTSRLGETENNSSSHPSEWSQLLQKNLKRICLSGEGKGRVQTAQEKHQMGYETLFEGDKGSWKISFFIPLRGEESLSLKWKGTDFNNSHIGVVGGEYYQKLMQSLKRTAPEDHQLLELFFHRLPLFLVFYDEIIHGGGLTSCAIDPLFETPGVQTGRCSLGHGQTLFWQQTANKLILRMPLTLTTEIIIESSSPTLQFYERTNFILRQWPDDTVLEKWRMDFSVQTCN